MDDTSFLEILNLIMAGLASLNPKNQVPSDIPPNMVFLPSENCKTQNYLDKMAKWTEEFQMKLNPIKSKYMIVNFCTNYQFRTRLVVNNSLLEQVHETRLLGLIIQDDLSWNSNTKSLVKKAYSRMIILRKLIEFEVKIQDMVTIYILFIRSVIEQSSVVWSSSLTVDEMTSLERTQKVALRIIFSQDYISYENALNQSKLPKIEDRYKTLLLRFALKCCKNQKTQNMFPLANQSERTRKHEHYDVPMARKNRFFKSSIPTMARMLNQHKNSKNNY